MADMVIATAGHIDHGKTTLVKALTGLDTDTLKEEKQRGLSINLGFAYLDLPDGKRVGIVDVPGHERFIKNMVAGLPGISLVLLVIDATEGIMAQTREHVEILTLLDIQNFLIILTKTTLADEELLGLIKEDIREQFANTPLENAPIIETDAVAGIGLEELQGFIQKQAEAVIDYEVSGPGRLNVDRVFTIKGFGTVVTGTLLDGCFKMADDLIVYPSGKKTKIRRIQVHGENQTQAFSGQRTALNLTNLSVSEIQRGAVLVSSGYHLTPTWMIDTKVTCLNTVSKGLTLWERVRVLIGTKEVFARIVPLGQEVIEPGETGYLQLRLEEPLTVKEADRFIFRSYSPSKTIGGGEILGAHPEKHKRFKKAVLESLKVRESGDLSALILNFVKEQKNDWTTLTELSEYLTQPAENLVPVLQQLMAEKRLVLFAPESWLHPERLQQITNEIVTLLQGYHKNYPLRKGMTKEELRSKLSFDWKAKIFDQLLNLLAENQTLAVQDQYFAVSGFKIVYNSRQQEAKKKIEAFLTASGYTPVKTSELNQVHPQAAEVLASLDHQSIRFLTNEFVVSHKAYAQVVDRMLAFTETHEHLTLADFRDLIQSSRKIALLWLEFFDKEGLTRRVGDYRVVVRKEREVVRT